MQQVRAEMRQKGTEVRSAGHAAFSSATVSLGPCNSAHYMVVLARRSLLGGNHAPAPTLAPGVWLAYLVSRRTIRFLSKRHYRLYDRHHSYAEKPSPTARAVAILAEGTRVRLYHCSEGWCGVSVQRLAGYALEEFLTTRPAKQLTTAPTQQGRGYINVDGEWVPSPTRTADGQPPPGASAKCRDGTFSFSRHRQGTCSHHGGVTEWL